MATNDQNPFGYAEPEEISDGEDEVTVRLDGPNGPKATYLRTTTIEEVLAALPAGWTVHEADWSNAVQIDDLTWSVPLTRAYEADMPAAREWARRATAGDYLVEYKDTGTTADEDPGSRCGFDDVQLDEIRQILARRDLQLDADDRGLVAVAK